ncbi:hypothetical protein, partial [Pseudomonas avellanae]
QSVLGQFSIGRVGQFSISANTHRDQWVTWKREQTLGTASWCGSTKTSALSTRVKMRTAGLLLHRNFFDKEVFQ